MRSYDSRVPRAAVGVVAAAMAALTLGVLVILPASMESGGEGRDMLAASNGAAGRCATASAQLQVSASRAPEAQHCAHSAREWLTTN